jgi:hypothetical protein
MPLLLAGLRTQAFRITLQIVCTFFDPTNCKAQPADTLVAGCRKWVGVPEHVLN